MQNNEIPKGYKNSPLGIIPEEWMVKRLGDCCILSSGGTPSKNNPEYWDGSIPWISAISMHEQYIYDSEYTITESGLKQGSKLAKQGDLLLLVRGSMLWSKIPICFCERDVAFNQDVKGIAVKKIATSIFLLYWFLSNEHKLLNDVVGTGIGAGKLETESLIKTHVLLPPLPEQQKIAEILTCWDDAIEKRTRLIEKLEIRKRGLMQQLLTGKKRLMGFEGRWKEVKLGEIGDTYNGLTGKRKEDFGKGKPYIPYLNIFNNSKVDTTFFDYVEIGIDENQNRVRHGDIFFTVSSETPDEVGMASVLMNDIAELYLNSFCFGYRLYNFDILLPEFSCYYLRSEIFRQEISKLSQGATRFNLSKNNLMKLIAVLPPIEEQIAIANILSTADNEVQKEKEKLMALKAQKKGLMQQLLTGKTRVKYKTKKECS